jgi:hypothetical protein
LIGAVCEELRARELAQRRGFRLNAVRIGAVDATRLRKPSIPLVGFDGIPLHDEIDLMLDF